MTSADLLTDSFGRIRELVHEVTRGLSAAELPERIDDESNSVAWLVWHLTRIQDDHLADASGREQVWTAQGWAGRFALPFEAGATGYGHSSADVAAVRVPSAELLTGYHDAVHDWTVEYVRTLTDPDLDRIVDESWDPPVTLAVRLVSVIGDGLQHAGQAAFINGILQRRRA
jgi:hypothetical protein